MSRAVVVLSLAVLWLVAAVRGDGVAVLDSDNWLEHLHSHEFTAVKFYAPWCGHCKKLAPVWDELAEYADKQLAGKVSIAKIDCTASSSQCGDIRSYPTLKFFRKNVPDDDTYEGERDLSNLKVWVEGKMKGYHSDVVEYLSLAELEKGIAENDALFVFFYAPWCGWCKRIKPVIEKVGTYFNTKPNPQKLVVAKIDSIANENAAATKYDIKVFPTFYFIRGKKLQIHPTVGQDYSRTFEQFVEWLTPRRGPASNPIADDAALESFRKDFPVSRFVAYVGDSGKEYERWKTFAESGLMDDFGRAHATYLPSGKQSGFVYAEDETGKAVASFDLKSSDDFKQFVIKSGYPVGGVLSDRHLRAQATTKVPLFAALFQSTPTDEQLVPFKAAAEAFAGKVLSGWTDDTEQAVKWGASGTKFPTAAVVKGLGSQDTYFVTYDEDKENWDTSSLTSYLQKVEKDNYPRYIRSEPVPENQDGPVTILVGKNFEDIVMDETKDVLVEFYAPWCGHCKKLSPIWDELGTLFKPVEDIVIAKIDATANTLPRGINANSFPTIMWFPKKNKLPIPYNQGRTLDNLKRYVLGAATRKNIDLEKESKAYKEKNAQKTDL